jgi:hypothetical protein
VDVNAEEVELLGGEQFVLHGLLDAKVELDGRDDRTEQGYDAGQTGDKGLVKVGLQAYGGDGVDA